MCKVAVHENHVRWIYLTTVLSMGEGQKYARNLLLWTYFWIPGRNLLTCRPHRSSVGPITRTRKMNLMKSSFDSVNLLQQNFAN